MAVRPPFLVLLFLVSLLLKAHLSFAADDTISIGQPLSGNRTIVSNGGSFELGFFTPGNSHNYYIGIWYKYIPVQTVVWVANREKPVKTTSSSELKISKDGNLVLLDQSKSQVWSTNSAPAATDSTVAVLLDSGNLVLRDGSNSSLVLWQSFDHPTNTWLPGAKLGLNKVTRETMLLTSWKSYEDPAPGPFSLGLDPNGTIQFKLWWNGTQEYFSSGLWNGHYFSALSEMIPTKSYTFNFVTNSRETYFNYSIRYEVYGTLVTGFVLDVDGQAQQSQWLNDTLEWSLFWNQPKDQYQVYSVCGAFGVCDRRKEPFCTCLDGFEVVSAYEWSLRDFSSGCVRKTPLSCGNSSSAGGVEDGFLPISYLQLPPNAEQWAARSTEECHRACLSNCSCKAYSYDDSCLVWHGELLNLQQPIGEDSNAGSLFVRLASNDLPDSGGKKSTVNGAFVGIICAGVAVICIILLLAWYFQRRGRIGKRGTTNVGSLVMFSYIYLQRATKNFSESLGGGGFGSVFKGVLPNMTAVAVKRLEGVTQGEKQFRTEVSTLGAIQHVNLVRLRGFCSEGAERLLVYDYMPKGSMESLLFRENSDSLDWTIRYQIAIGMARGLAYLHEECRDCIIHCDVKPENVLLDENFCPKLADFGLAKLIGRDFSRVMTTTRGTKGYLAPEWISGLPITTKADVYSFGMVLFEIISGRRNSHRSEDGDFLFFPILAANKLNEGDVSSLLDQKLDGKAGIEELKRVCKVACWCIQDHEKHRPSMGKVVQILEGVAEVEMPPIPKFLQNLVELHEAFAPLEFSSGPEISISR